ncbi:Heat shock cognate 71 kDa protein, partial [Galemys pyrenaicus]
MVLTKIKEIAATNLGKTVPKPYCQYHFRPPKMLELSLASICSGEDFDHFILDFTLNHKIDINENEKTVYRLHTACESVLRLIHSKKKSTSISSLPVPDLKNLMLICSGAPLSWWRKLSGMPVGTCIQFPPIQKCLQNFLHGKELNESIEIDAVITYGAIVQAAILSGATFGNVYNLLLLGVTPLSLDMIKVTFDINVNVTPNVSAVDKGTGRENKITIINDKGLLSKKTLNNYKAEDEKQRNNVSCKNSLDSYAFNMKATVEDEKLQSKTNDENKQKILSKSNEINWLNKNQTTEKEEFEHQQKEQEKVCNPIISKLSQCRWHVRGYAWGSLGGWSSSIWGYLLCFRHMPGL